MIKLLWVIQWFALLVRQLPWTVMAIKTGLTTTSPPDGGYGWMIVVASFIGNFVTDGVQFSFGILLVDLTTHFRSDFATVAMAGGTLTLSFLTFGIIATSLVAVFGCRKMFAIGGLLSAASFFASTFSRPCRFAFGKGHWSYSSVNVWGLEGSLDETGLSSFCCCFRCRV